MSQYLAARLGRAVVVVALVAAAMPMEAGAQFGALKRLKNAISPDSAAKVEAAKNDSIALAAKLAAGDTTPLERSKFSRAVSGAVAASEKFEAVTGVSAKDAALAATGAGVAGLAAKKLGVDVNPMSLGAKALGNAANAQAQAKLGLGGIPGMPSLPGAGSIPGMPNMADMMKMQQAATVQLQGARQQISGGEVATRAAYVGAGFTEEDARALAAFQSEMMQVAMAANAGDAAAQARLASWEAIALKYQPEIEKLSVSASAGDMASVQRLQQIQVSIIRDWVNTGSTKAKVLKAVKPTKSAKP